MVAFRLTMSKTSVRHFRMVVQCISKLGADLSIIATPNELLFRTIASADSATFSVRFLPAFFDEYYVEHPGDWRAAVLLKHVLSSLRTQKIAEYQLELSETSEHLTAHITADSGLRKVYRMDCMYAEFMTAQYNTDQYPTMILVQAKELTKLLSSFQPSLNELILIIKPGTAGSSPSCQFSSWNVTDPDKPFEAIKAAVAVQQYTSVLVDTREKFKEFVHTSNTSSDVTFNLKDFRAMLTLCEHFQTQVIIRMNEPGLPVIVEPGMGEPGSYIPLTAELVLSTFPDSQEHTAQQVPTSGTPSQRQQTQPMRYQQQYGSQQYQQQQQQQYQQQQQPYQQQQQPYQQQQQPYQQQQQQYPQQQQAPNTGQHMSAHQTSPFPPGVARGNLPAGYQQQGPPQWPMQADVQPQHADPPTRGMDAAPGWRATHAGMTNDRLHNRDQNGLDAGNAPRHHAQPQDDPEQLPGAAAWHHQGAAMAHRQQPQDDPEQLPGALAWNQGPTHGLPARGMAQGQQAAALTGVGTMLGGAAAAMQTSPAVAAASGYQQHAGRPSGSGPGQPQPTPGGGYVHAGSGQPTSALGGYMQPGAGSAPAGSGYRSGAGSGYPPSHSSAGSGQPQSALGSGHLSSGAGTGHPPSALGSGQPSSALGTGHTHSGTVSGQLHSSLGNMNHSGSLGQPPAPLHDPLPQALGSGATAGQQQGPAAGMQWGQAPHGPVAGAWPQGAPAPHAAMPGPVASQGTVAGGHQMAPAGGHQMAAQWQMDGTEDQDNASGQQQGMMIALLPGTPDPEEEEEEEGEDQRGDTSMDTEALLQVPRAPRLTRGIFEGDDIDV